MVSGLYISCLSVQLPPYLHQVQDNRSILYVQQSGSDICPESMFTSSSKLCAVRWLVEERSIYHAFHEPLL